MSLGVRRTFGIFMTRKALFIAAFGLLYTTGTAGALVLSMSATLSGFEPGEPRASLGAIHFFDLLTQGLMFPLIPLFAPNGALRYWALVFGNGVLWGLALVALWSAVTRRRLRRRSPFSPPA